MAAGVRVAANRFTQGLQFVQQLCPPPGRQTAESFDKFFLRLFQFYENGNGEWRRAPVPLLGVIFVASSFLGSFYLFEIVLLFDEQPTMVDHPYSRTSS
jgi:hypothetical protein